jgi:hypothetical protein
MSLQLVPPGADSAIGTPVPGLNRRRTLTTDPDRQPANKERKNRPCHTLPDNLNRRQ